MVKKLLLKVFTFWAFILTSILGWGQCPTAVNITATPGTTICAGTQITFSANISGGTDVQYQWEIDRAAVNGETNSSFSPNTLANGQKVRVVTTSGTTGETCSKASNELTVTVNPVQTPTVSISTTKTSICPGESITFSASNTFGGTSPQYEWFINSGNTVAKSGASATFTASEFTEGNNTVRVRLTSNFDCASSSTAEATSSAFVLKPDATISTPTNKDQSICINSPLQNITFSLGGGATNATVTGLPAGITGSMSGGNYILSGSPSSSGVFPYTVTTTGTCAQKTLTGTINVAPNATIALSSGNNSQTICAAGGVTGYNISPITYSVGETGTGAAVTGLPQGINGSFNNGVFTIEGSSTQPGTYNYSIKATGTCGDSAPLTGSIIITENKVPSVSIVSSDADNVICAGTAVTFTATPSNGGTNPSYQWKIDGSGVGTNSSKFTTSTLSDGQKVTVEMSSSEACISTATVSSNIITTTVDPNLTPAVTIEASDSDICPGDPVTFTATPVHGGTNPVYQWKIGNTNVGSNSPEYTTSTLTDGQSVSVVLTSTETCLATASATSNSIVTTVQAPPPSAPGAITGPEEVCATATGLVYSIEAVTDAENYVWSFPAGWVIEGQGTRTATFSASSTGGDISVAAENSCGTSTNSSLAVTTVNGVPATPGEIASSLPDDNKNICPPLSTLTFSVPAVSGAVGYQWTLPYPGWEILSGEGTESITVRVTSASTNGAKEVKVEAVNICGNSAASTYTGIVVDTHIIADVGEDQTVCKSENSITINGTRSFGSANLKSTITSSGTGTIKNDPGNGSGTFIFQYEPSELDRSNGEVTITITVPTPAGGNNTGNQCGSAVDEMTIFFKPDAKIIPPSNVDQLVCINSAISPIEFTLEGTQSGATVTGLPAGVTGSYSNGSFIISGSPTEAGTFEYIINTTGDCTQTSTTGIISVDPLTTVTAGNAATDVVCQSGNPVPITLTGAGFGGGATAAAWSITSGGGILSDTGETANPSSITYTPAANYTGEVVLTLTTNAPGECPAVSDTRTIDIQPSPTVDAGEAPTDILCQSENPAPITLTGATFGGGATSAAWSITSGGGTLSSLELTNNPQNIAYTPAAGYSGEVILSLISNAPGVCSAVSDTRIITIEPAPTVDAGEASTDIVCQSSNPSPIILSGAGFGGGATTAAWTLTSGQGTLSNTAQTSSSETVTFTPQPDFQGEIILTLTSSGPATCSPVTDTRTITIEPAAIVEAGGIEGGEEGGCQSATPEVINLSGASLSGGAVTAAWSITQGGGTLSSTTQTSQPELVTYTPDPNFTGTVILTLTSAPAGNCPAVSDTRIIQISQALTVEAGVDIDICSGSTIPLSDITLGAGVTSARWEIVSGPGELSSTSEVANPETVTFTAPSQSKGQTVLRLTSNNPDGICEAIYDEKIINIQQEVTITTPPVNDGICSTQNAIFEVVASGDNLSYQWFHEGTPVANATASRLVINQATSQNAGSYTVEITGEASCGNPIVSEAVTLNVDEDIVIDTQPQGGDYCTGSTVTLSVEASAGEAELKYEWFNSSNESVGNGASISFENVQPEFSGDYYAIITGPDGFTCSTATSTSVTVIVNPSPTITAMGDDLDICLNGNPYDITEGTSAENFSSLKWTVPEGTGTIANENSLTEATFTPAEDAPSEVIVTLTAYGLDGCSEITGTKTITIIPQPEIIQFSYVPENNEAISAEFCETDITSYTPHIFGNNLSNGTGTFSVNDPILIIDPTTGAITPNGTSPGKYVITYTYTITSQEAGCKVAEKTFEVIIGEKPVADFTYGENPFCSDSPNVTPTFLNGGVAGTFNPSNAGLVLINTSTGEIDFAASTPGNYEITNTVDYSAQGCAVVTYTAPITINKKPIPDFSYSATEFCSAPDVEQIITPVLEVGAVKGTFSYTAVPEGILLSLDTTTGNIDVMSSDAGEFIITNTVEIEADGCEEVEYSFSINIEKRSNPSFEYTSTSFCIATKNASVLENYEIGGTFSSPTLGTLLNPATGAITWTETDAITGPHEITYTIEGKGACEDVSSTVEINIDPLPVGGKLAFEDLVTTNNNGRIFMICEGATSGYLPITSGHTGNILAWKYSINGAAWITIPGEGGNFTGDTLSAATIKGLNLPETTVFRVEIGSGACSPSVFSQTAILSVIPTDITPSPVTVSENVVCLGDIITLSSETGYTNGLPTIENGNFDNAGIKNSGWRFELDGRNMNFETNANNTNQDYWSRATPHDFNTANYNTSPYSTSPMRWDAGVEDGNKGFALVSGNHNATMETNTFGIGPMDQAIVTFDQAYNLTPGATVTVEISEDGGNSYQAVLFTMSGSASSGHYSSFGTGTPESRPENKMVLDLGNYLGKNNLRLKFTFDGARDGDLWAVDGIKLPEGPRNVTIEWNDYTNPEEVIQIGTTNSVQYDPKQIGLNIFEVKTKLIFDSTGNACEVAENAENISVFVFDNYTTSVSAEYGSCGKFEAQLTASVLNGKNETVQNYPTPDGYIGKWVITGAGATLVDSNPDDNIAAENDPNAILHTMATGTYNVSWVLEPTEKDENGNLYENPEDCAPDVTPLEVVIAGCIALDFDGDNDHIIIDDPYPGVVSFEAWIRPTATGGTIISGPNLHITTPGTVTANSRWYHIAVSEGKLYLDGIEKTSLALGNGTGSQTVIGAELVNGEATNLFSGWIEEVRLWKKALTVEQIRFLMNQRLLANGAQMGEQIPMNVPGGLTYSDLAGYYRLISAVPEPLQQSPVVYLAEDMPANGLTPDRANTKSPGRLINMETNQQNTAPLPYYSGKDGVWGTDDTWLRPDVWDPPHTGSIEWNIVRTSHNITSGSREIFLLGLISEANVLNMEGTNPANWTSGGSGNELNISHYLLLDGIIDLNGESQLVQPNGSLVEQSGGVNKAVTGYLDRDQQGTASSYNYNYWSSPVSPGAGNSPYSVGAVMMDGTTATPQPLMFGNAYHHADGAAATPRKVSAYWLHKFHGTANNYFRWEHIGSAGTLNVGEGYSMKGTSGPAAILESQNYTFRGLPNNGDILMVNLNASGKGENYLIGNPYPSALNIDEFILDNMKDVANGRNSLNIFNGTVYFWSHFANKTHYLEEYIGGYAAYNFSGGVKAAAIDERINATEQEGGREPRQFIPVGQGFFVSTQLDAVISSMTGTTIHGGQAIFKNSQRVFMNEVDPGKSVFHSAEKKDLTSGTTNTNSKAEQQRIWLKFQSPKGYHRQILVTADPNATDNFDLGYDAPLIENNAEDMYWYFNEHGFVIQGVEDFNSERELQLGFKVKDKGTIKISIDKLANIEDDKPIYLKDSLLGVIHDLRKEPYIIDSEEGVFTERFKLVFRDASVIEPEDPVVETDGPFEIMYINGTRIILIKNPELIKVSRIYLNNLLGQQVHVYYDVPLETKVELPVERFSSGVYILKLHTENGIITKKVILE